MWELPQITILQFNLEYVGTTTLLNAEPIYLKNESILKKGDFYFINLFSPNHLLLKIGPSFKFSL
ncbi:hypothetical protein LMANV2_540010 [Leptospira interrogans serovar Manilae]|uniref:Uncharacterized protein n=1 Tax=Leptospira interrogans serovar Manilae TaxID=214675 RepID=A0AAQ1SQ06_LEPIR|nr:hypothetical protein LMANV2_540010 [Leptospira interrogans serovar Manilae]